VEVLNAGPADQTPPKATVLIAAYNAAAFIHRAIASACGQTEADIEILVVDDASTDNTAAVVTSLARTDPRIVLLRLTENGGPSVARNAGMEAARGAWIAVLDADDAFVPGRIATLLGVAAEAGADIIADNFSSYDPATGRESAASLPTGTGLRRIALADFLRQARPYGVEVDWGLLKPIFRRAFFVQNNLRYDPQVRHGEDFLLIVQALAAGARYALSDQLGYIYTSRSSGWSRTRIDYDSMIRQSETLMTLPAIAGRADLQELLRQRMAALRRLITARRMRGHLDARRLGALLREAVGSVDGLRETPVILRRALRQALRR